MSVLAAFNRLDDATDGQLLGRFVQAHDADAFAALVRRLGPTVLAVCRRVCPDSHLAEDAFQAAFLVLARKADTVRPREQVAVWLHGVAYRTASKARAMLSARRRREVASPTLPDPPAPDPVIPDDDELRKLDDAIAALPEHLRAAVVLCELEGRSRRDAAKQLGIAEGTLSSRLADARKRLGERLRPTVAAVVTAALAASTAEAVVSGSTSETVRSLARGVMSMLLLNKLKAPAVVALLLATAALTGLGLTSWPSPPASAAPVPKSLKPAGGMIAVTRGGTLFLLTPDGKEVHKFDVYDRLKEERLGESVAQVQAFPSPKGGFPLAVMVTWYRKTAERGGNHTYELRLIRSADDPKGEVIDVGGEQLPADRVVWARDGKQAFVGCWATNADRKQGWTAQRKYLALDPVTGKTTAAALPEHHQPVGGTADGGLVTVLGGGPEMREVNAWPLRRVSADGKTVDKLKPARYERSLPELDLAADGRTVLHRWFFSATGECALLAFDAVTGEKADIVPKALAGEKLNGKKLFVHSARWSPDGKRVGLVYSLANDVQQRNEADRVLHVCDHDGSNGADIFTWSGKDEVWNGRFEWN